jgi:hypothetical protein
MLMAQSHQKVELPLGLDGESYYYITPHGCATTWSPRGDTRAAGMVTLFWSLVARARKDTPAKEKTGDATLLKAIDALRSDARKAG